MATIKTDSGTVRTATRRRYVMIAFPVTGMYPFASGYSDSLESARARARRSSLRTEIYEVRTGERVS